MIKPSAVIGMLLILLLTGCAHRTPINQLSYPPVSVIEGTITQVDNNGFTLQDASGVIFVKAELPVGRKLDLARQENVTVYGNLEGGQKRIFDGYVIKKASGELIMVNNPTPHLGFIVQSAF